MRAITIRASALVWLGMLLACGNSPPSSSAKSTANAKSAADAKKEAPPAKAATPEASAPYEYSYNPLGKRDPFRSVLDDVTEGISDAANVRPDCGPLCKWELEQLRLVAVISGISNPLGMVEDPNGRGYVLRRGTYVGKHNGKVTQIRTGEIVVTEIYKDQMNKPHVNPVVIRLPGDAEQNDQEDQNLLTPEVAE